jgi:putative transposase
MDKRNTYSPEFKTKLVLEVLREERTVNQIASIHALNPMLISRWKAEFLERASMVFEKGPSEAEKLKREFEERQELLEKKIGQLIVEVDWLKKKSGIK